MTSASEIEDRKTLEAWLETRPRQDAVVIAHRSAMRVLPLWGAIMDADWVPRKGLTALPLLRSGLITGIATAFPITSDVAARAADHADATADRANAVFRAAARASARGASTAASANSMEAASGISADAATATRAAAYAAYATAAQAGAAAVWAMAKSDALALENEDTVMQSELWLGSTPLWFQAADKDMISVWDTEPKARWMFWRRWWQGVATGRQIDWQLQLAIVEGIDDETWENPDAVAARIAEIETAFAGPTKGRDKNIDKAISETPNGERIEGNPTSQKLILVPEPEITDNLYAYASRKVLTTIEIVRRDRGQQYTALHVDLEMLESAVDSDPSLPIELYDACQAALTRLNARCGNGELPDLENDALLQDYRSRLRDAGSDLFGNDPMTQNVIATRNKVLGNDVFVENADDVKRAVEEIQPALEGTLADALPHNAEVATNVHLDVEDRKSDTYKLVSRVVRIAKIAAIGIGAVGGAVIGTAGVIEAIPVIQGSQHFQYLLELALKWLGLA